MRRRRILFLSRSYPNNVFPLLGLWIERLVRHCSSECDISVISPVPYYPPVPGLRQHTRFRDVVRYAKHEQVDVYYPRFLVGPGRSLYLTEAWAYYYSARVIAQRLHAQAPLDLIHAHFMYPDGVAAARIGNKLGIPVVVTEHAPWHPNWMEKSPSVRKQAISAARSSRCQIAVSNSVRDTILHFTGQPEKVRVIPNGVDGDVFTEPADEHQRKVDQILFVGLINFNKGVDTLLKAMKLLASRAPKLRLVLVGGSFYRNTGFQERQLRLLAQNLNLQSSVEFVGMQPPSEVARYMRESSMLVLPSRAESFGAVLVEALSSGTPVVATRCGGPEDIVTPDNGLLIERDNPEALASAIVTLQDRRSKYESSQLRRAALQRFSWLRVARQNLDLYSEIVEMSQGQ